LKGGTEVKKEEAGRLERENAFLRERLKSLIRVKPISIKNYRGKSVKIGLVSDTHLASLYSRLEWLRAAYKVFDSEGITVVYHAGDIADGERMYRGQEYELEVMGADNQVKYIVEKYPHYKGITTYFILGNHDLSFWKTSGTNIGERITQFRQDLQCVGLEEADIPISVNGRIVTIRLSHPGKGTAYALSYHPQKYIESLTGGEKPEVIFMGHYHKAEYMFYRNVHLVQAGTLQMQTPFMRRQNISAMTGFWIIEFMVSEIGISRFKPEFFPFFSRK
jgi:predicted phosphodiesterase